MNLALTWSVSNKRSFLFDPNDVVLDNQSDHVDYVHVRLRRNRVAIVGLKKQIGNKREHRDLPCNVCTRVPNDRLIDRSTEGLRTILLIRASRVARRNHRGNRKLGVVQIGKFVTDLACKEIQLKSNATRLHIGQRIQIDRLAETLATNLAQQCRQTLAFFALT